MNDSAQPATRRRFWLLVLPLLVVGLAAWLAFSQRAPAVADTAAPTVNMTDDMRYVPRTVRIESGQRVTWRNTSSVPHTVTAKPELASDRSNVRLPEGAAPFNSGNIAAGKSYSRTFTTRGTYVYFCIPHEGQKMVGTIVVE